MGSPISPIATNAFMEKFELTAIAKAPASSHIRGKIRNVDDTCVITKKAC